MTSYSHNLSITRNQLQAQWEGQIFLTSRIPTYLPKYVSSWQALSLVSLFLLLVLSQAVFQTAIMNDTLFLHDVKIVDYSIVVGLDQDRRELVSTLAAPWGVSTTAPDWLAKTSRAGIFYHDLTNRPIYLLILCTGYSVCIYSWRCGCAFCGACASKLYML